MYILLLIGFVLGYFSKGITITINKKEPDFEHEEFNDSPTHLIDPEVKQYLDQNYGNIKI